MCVYIYIYIYIYIYVYIYICIYIHACMFCKGDFYFSLTHFYCSNGSRNAFLSKFTFNLVKMMQTNIYCVDVIHTYINTHRRKTRIKRNAYLLE